VERLIAGIDLNGDGRITWDRVKAGCRRTST
jgi:hypothetical protein